MVDIMVWDQLHLSFGAIGGIFRRTSEDSKVDKGISGSRTKLIGRT